MKRWSEAQQMLGATVLCLLDLINCWHSEAIFLMVTHIDVATVC